MPRSAPPAVSSPPTSRVEIVRRRGPAWLSGAVLAASVGFVGLNTFADQLLPRTISEVGGRETLLDPAPWAFSIWGPIFLGLLAYGLYQWLPATRHRPGPAGARLPLLVSFLAGMGWPVAIAYGQFGVAFALIVAMLSGAAVALSRIAPGRAGWAERLCARWPVSLYAGWLTLATLLSALGVLRHDLALSAVVNSEAAWAVGGVAVAGAAAATLALWRRDLLFAGAIVWGLAAVAINEPMPAIRSAVFAAIGVIVAAAAIGWGADRRA